MIEDVVEAGVVEDRAASTGMAASPATPAAGVVHRLLNGIPRPKEEPKPSTEPQPKAELLPLAASKPNRLPSVQTKPCRVAVFSPADEASQESLLPKQIGRIAEVPSWANESSNAVQVNPFAK